MSEIAVAWIRGSIVTVSEVAGRHDAKGPDCRQRATLRSPECVFAIAGVVNDFAVTAARQVEPARKHVARVGATIPWIAIALRPARIIAIAVVRTVTSIMSIVVTVTVIVMRLDLRRTRSSSERQRVVIVTAVAPVPVSGVTQIACVIVIARIEVHTPSTGQFRAGLLVSTMDSGGCTREAILGGVPGPGQWHAHRVVRLGGLRRYVANEGTPLKSASMTTRSQQPTMKSCSCKRYRTYGIRAS